MKVLEKLKSAGSFLTDNFDKFRNTRFGRKFLDIVYETAILLSYIGAIALIHKAEKRWMGEGATFFGKVKVESIIDVGHLLALGLFFLEITKDVIEVLKAILDIIVKAIVQALKDIKSLWS